MGQKPNEPTAKNTIRGLNWCDLLDFWNFSVGFFGEAKNTSI